MKIKKFWLILLATALLISTLAVSTFAANEPVLDIQNRSISLDSAIYMNFKVAYTNVAKEDISLLVWTKPQESYIKGTEEMALLSEGAEKGREVFVYTNIDSRKMTDVVYARAYAVVNGKEIYSAPTSFSVKEYAYRISKLPNQESLQALINDMLRYGASAQQYFNYHTDFLATDSACEIKTVGATLADGLTSGIYQNGATVTVTAGAPAAGMQFSHFENSKGQTVGTVNPMTVTVSEDSTYTAVYREGQAVSLRNAPLTDTAYENVAMDDVAPISVPTVAALETNVANSLAIQNRSISLDSAIYINFKVMPANFRKEDISLLVWTKPQETYTKGTEDVVLLSEGTDAKGREIFVYKNIDSRKMTDVVYARVYVNVNGVETYSEPVSFSVKEYACRIDKMEGQTALKKLVNDMLSYGASAQKYFNYHLDFLATDKAYEIKAENATLADGMTSGIYKEGTTAEMTANAPQDGFILSHFASTSDKTIHSGNPLKVTAHADETYVASYKPFKKIGSEGLSYKPNPDGATCVITGIGTCKDTDVRIPDYIDQYTVRSIGAGAFAKNTVMQRRMATFAATDTQDSGLRSITIPRTVSSIGENAFAGQNNLTSVVMASSVTNIGKNAFVGCEKLDSVYYGGSTEQLNKIRIDTGNENLTKTEKYTHTDIQWQINRAFGLQWEHIYGTQTCKVTGIGSFQGTDLYIPDQIQGYTVIEIGERAFENCTNLQSVIIPEGITNIRSYAFNGCTNLTSVTLPDSLTSVQFSAFYQCPKLEYVFIKSLDNWTKYNLADSSFSNGYNLYQNDRLITEFCFPQQSGIIMGAIQYCKSITNVTIPYGVKTIGYGAFAGCENLKTLILPESVTRIGENIIRGCDSITSMTVPGSIQTIPREAFANCKGLQSITFLDGVQEIEWDAFLESENIETIHIPDSIIHVSDNLLNTCQHLHYTVYKNGKYVGNAENPYVVLIGIVNPDEPFLEMHPQSKAIAGTALREYHNLQRIVLTEKLKWISNDVFEKCYLLQYNNYGNGSYLGNQNNPYYVLIKANNPYISECEIHPQAKIIGDRAFYSCSNLTAVTVPTGVESIGKEAFSYCGNLNSVDIPNGITRVEAHLFSGCNNLNSVTIPDSVKEIGEYAFSGCYNLRVLTLPNNLICIENNAFEECRSLLNITIPDSVTEIGWYAFFGCDSITKIVLPKNLKTGSNFLIDSCENLTTVVWSEGLTDCFNCAFSCPNLDKFIIPHSMQRIHSYDCMAPNVFYAGSPDEWNQIEKASFDGKWGNARIYCYSENRPTGAGDYWNRINDDISIWEKNPSVGLAYYVNESQKTCAISGIGTCTEEYIKIPETINGYTVVGVGSGAFKNDQMLKEIEIPSTVKYIGSSAFYGSRFLKTVKISEGLIGIENDAFCSSALQNIHFPDTLMYIGDHAFDRCPLQSVVLNQNLKEIGEEAFPDVDHIAIPKSLVSVGQSTFQNASVIEVEDLEQFLHLNVKKAYEWDLYVGGQKLTDVYIPDGTTTISDAFRGCRSIQTVHIPATVTEIDEYAFSGCTSLREVHMTDGLKKIGKGAFRGCIALNAIAIPDSVTFIGNSAFSSCGIVTAVLPKGLKSIEYELFMQCNQLQSVGIPSGVQSIGGHAFAGCAQLQSISIPDSVETIEMYAFQYCNQLKDIALPGNLKTIRMGAFLGCDNLTSLSVPDSLRIVEENAFPLFGNMQYHIYENGKYLGNEQNPYFVLVDIIDKGVTSFVMHTDTKMIAERVLSACYQMSSLQISNNMYTFDKRMFDEIPSLQYTVYKGGKYLGNAENPYWLLAGSENAYITNCEIHPQAKAIADHAFESCNNLSEITIPDGIEYMGRYIFWLCSNLKKVTLPGTIKTISEGMFSSCENLMSIDIPEGTTVIGESAFSGCTRLQSLTIPSTVERIDGNAFYGCQWLKNITIPSGVKTISHYAFSNCSNLNTLEISEGVEVIGIGAFSECRNLTSVQLPSSIQSIGIKAFQQTSRLARVDINNLEQWLNIPIGQYPFNPGYYLYCNQKLVTEVAFPSGITHVDGRFAGCGSIQKVTIPAGAVCIDEGAFYGCNNLKSVVIPDGMQKIGNRAFEKCTSLSSAILPEGLTTVGERAFSLCVSLQEVYLPDTVTEIGANAFEGSKIKQFTIPKGVTELRPFTFNSCRELNSIIIPENIQYIGKSAFARCEKLTSVIIPGTVSHIEEYAFGQTGLHTVVLKEGIDTLDAQIFAWTPNLYTVKIPASVMHINGNPFQGSNKQIHITVAPESYKYCVDQNCLIERTTMRIIDGRLATAIPDNAYRIESYAFAGNLNLKDVTLPKNLVSIGKNAFDSCTNLKSIIIPETVTEIGETAFHLCKNLSVIYFEGLEMDWSRLIEKNKQDKEFYSIPVYFYAESNPAGYHTYWHYVNGKPTRW